MRSMPHSGAVELIIQFARRRLAVVLTSLAMSIFALALIVLPTEGPGATNQFVSEVMREYLYGSSYDQRTGHALTVAMTAIFCGMAFYLAKRGWLKYQDERIFWKLSAIETATIAVAGLLLYALWLPSWFVRDATAVVGLFALFVVAAPRLSVRALDLVLVGTIGAYGAILVVPGLLLVNPIALMAEGPSPLAQFELHILEMTMGGRAVSSGMKLIGQLPYGYGILAPSIMSVIDHRIHAMTIGDLLRYVQIMQLCFIVAAIGAYISYRPRNPLGVLTAILIAGPYWATAGLGIWHPNQTGFRSLGFPVGILAMTLVGRLDLTRTAWCLGAVAAVAFLNNMETAVALSAGFAVYMILRSRQIPIRLLLHASAAVLIAFSVYLVLYRLALGRWALGLQLDDIVAPFERFTSGGFGIRLFSAGSEGEGFYNVPLMLLMFCHSIYIIIHAFMTLGRRPLTQHESVRAAVATVLVIWLSYYFNAPNWWQLWTHLFLYGFLIIDVMDPRLFAVGFPASHLRGLGARLYGMRIAPTRLALLFLLGLTVVQTNRNLIKYLADFMYPPWMDKPHDASIVSDIMLPKAMADALVAKAEKLTKLNSAAKSSLVYLTFNTAFMPGLTGLFERAPERDLWVGIPGDAAFDGTMQRILDRHPDVVLIDAPEGPLGVTGQRRQFQDRVRLAVGRSYGLSDTEAGWQIWRPLRGSENETPPPVPSDPGAPSTR